LTQFAVFASGFLLLSALAGLAYQRFGTLHDAKKYLPPGRLIEVGSHRLHVFEEGQGNPTILLEAGLMSTILSWTELQSELAKSFRVVSYDRAGLGWSDLGPMPRTADRIVGELHVMLQKAKIPPPYVLVGHSFGGLTMLHYAACFPAEVAGMVLVDPVAPQEWDPPAEKDLRLSRIGAKVCRRAALLARMGVIRFIVRLLSTGARVPAAYLVRLISRGTPADAGSLSSPWFAALPAKERAMASVFWVQPKFALTVASQLENLPVSAALVSEFGNFCDKPVVILSAATASPRRREGHAAMARRLPLGKHLLVSKSNHWIMQEQPDLVLSAIKAAAGNLNPASPSQRRVRADEISETSLSCVSQCRARASNRKTRGESRS
jgi:pimeloyl-ACP methyl ester carboxylesterase